MSLKKLQEMLNSSIFMNGNLQKFGKQQVRPEVFIWKYDNWETSNVKLPCRVLKHSQQSEELECTMLRKCVLFFLV